MKIGILTFHHVVNDGAVLQTIAHVAILKELFPKATVEVIDYRHKTVERNEFLNPYKTLLKLKSDGFSKLTKYKKFREFMNKNLPLSNKKLISSNTVEAVNFINDLGYDYIIVGSDEILKVQNKPNSRLFPTIYWLPPQVKAIKIGSAVSANSSNEDLLKLDAVKQYQKKSVESFKVIGARDVFTRNILKSLETTTPIYDVPDPTFALSTEDIDVRPKLEKLGVDFNRKRWMLNLTSNQKDFNRISKEIKAYTTQENIQLINVGQYNSYCDINLTDSLNPLEWAACYRHFDFCISDRFHSTIFSFKAGIPFITLEFKEKYTGLNKGKVFDFLTKVDKLNYHSTIDDDIKVIDRINGIIEKHDSNELIQKSNELRTQFSNHLKNAIENE